MRVNDLAKMMAAFKKAVSPEEAKKIKDRNLVKYYRHLIWAKQVFPLLNEDGILIALCEVWKVDELAAKRIREKKPPQNIFKGDILFVTSVLMDKAFINTGIYRFYRVMLKKLYAGGMKKVFWYNAKHDHFTKEFKIKE